jgi:GT2 family glycosyltransferase
VHPGALAALVDFLDHQPKAGAVGSALVGGDGVLQTSCSPAPTVGRELWRLLHLDRLYPLAQYPMQRWSRVEPRPVDVVQGASLLLRRAALEQIGPLDETYFMYTEETDLCYRLRRAGWSVYWAPASVVTHYGGQSTRQIATMMFLQLYRSKLLYFRKHYGLRAGARYKGVLYLTGGLRVLLSEIVGIVRPAQRQQQRQIAQNYRQLLAALAAM